MAPSHLAVPLRNSWECAGMLLSKLIRRWYVHSRGIRHTDGAIGRAQFDLAMYASLQQGASAALVRGVLLACRWHGGRGYGACFWHWREKATVSDWVCGAGA